MQAMPVTTLTKQELLLAIGARLERCEKHVARAAVAWLEIVAAGSPSYELRRPARLKALGEVWRRDKLRALWAEVRAADGPDLQDRIVMFLALDACTPQTIPSFLEWIEEGGRGESRPPSPPA